MNSAPESSHGNPFGYDDHYNTPAGGVSSQANRHGDEISGANYINPGKADNEADEKQTEARDVDHSEEELFGVLHLAAGDVNSRRNEAYKYQTGSHDVKQSKAANIGPFYIESDDVNPDHNQAEKYQARIRRSIHGEAEKFGTSYVEAGHVRSNNNNAYMNHAEIPAVKHSKLEKVGSYRKETNMNDPGSTDPWYNAANKNRFPYTETYSNQPWSNNPLGIYANGNRANDRTFNHPVANVTTYNGLQSSEVNNSRTKNFGGSYIEAGHSNAHDNQAYKHEARITEINHNERNETGSEWYVKSWLGNDNKASGHREANYPAAQNSTSYNKHLESSEANSDSSLSRPISELHSVGPMTSETLTVRVNLLDLLNNSNFLQEALLAQHLRRNHVFILPDAHGLHLAVNFDNAGIPTQLADPFKPFTTTLLRPALLEHLRAYTLLIPTHHGWLSDAALAYQQRVAFLQFASPGGGPGVVPTQEQQRNWFELRRKLEKHERAEHRVRVGRRILDLAVAMAEAIKEDGPTGNFAREWTRGEILFQEFCDGWGERCGAENMLVEAVREKFKEAGVHHGRRVQGRLAEGETVVGEW